MGYKEGNVVESPEHYAAVRAEANADAAADADSFANLKAGHASSAPPRRTRC